MRMSKKEQRYDGRLFIYEDKPCKTANYWNCSDVSIFNYFDDLFQFVQWEKDGKDIPKIHPSQKPVNVIKQLVEIFTDEGDVVIDPCCGSGSTLRACLELNRNAYGFEIDRNFYTRAKNEMLAEPKNVQTSMSDFLGGE